MIGRHRMLPTAGGASRQPVLSQLVFAALVLRVSPGACAAWLRGKRRHRCAAPSLLRAAAPWPGPRSSSPTANPRPKELQRPRNRRKPGSSIRPLSESVRCNVPWASTASIDTLMNSILRALCLLAFSAGNLWAQVPSTAGQNGSRLPAAPGTGPQPARSLCAVAWKRSISLGASHYRKGSGF